MEAILGINKINCIGDDGVLPWYNKEDLKHFKKLTDVKTLLVGRKTYEMLPNLPNRKVIVVGKGFNTLEDALNMDIDFIIGGANIYNQTLHLCDVIHVSNIDNDIVGDTFLTIPEELNDRIVNYYF
jgi:dihydrofolate reductase